MHKPELALSERQRASADDAGAAANRERARVRHERIASHDSVRDKRLPATLSGMVVTRLATPPDAGAVAATMSEGFETYRAWAPSDWRPPVVGEGDQERFAHALARPDVWFLVAESDGTVIGHVALSLSTREDPGPPPPGTVFIWQLFVRPEWHGHGTATVLMRAAVSEALTRGFSHMRLWTPEGAARARRFYEREGWTLTGRVHRRSDFGLPTVEYSRDSR